MSNLCIPPDTTDFQKDFQDKLIRDSECLRSKKQRVMKAVQIAAEAYVTDPLLVEHIKPFLIDSEPESRVSVTVEIHQLHYASECHISEPTVCAPPQLESQVCDAVSTVYIGHEFGEERRSPQIDHFHHNISIDDRIQFGVARNHYEQFILPYAQKFENNLNVKVLENLTNSVPVEVRDKVCEHLTCREKFQLMLQTGLELRGCKQQTIIRGTPPRQCTGVLKACICKTALFRAPRLLRNKNVAWALRHTEFQNKYSRKHDSIKISMNTWTYGYKSIAQERIQDKGGGMV